MGSPKRSGDDGGLDRDDVSHILDSFSVLRKKEEQEHDEYRTKRVVMERYDAMGDAIRTGMPYVTALDPPPADPRVAHPESSRPAWLKAVATAPGKDGGR